MRSMKQKIAAGAPKKSRFLANCANRPGLVVALDADRGVHLLADLVPRRPVRLVKWRRVDVVGRRLDGSVGEKRSEPGHRVAVHDVDPPRLDVPTRGGSRRGREQLRDRLVADRVGQECPNRLAGVHGIGHVHVGSLVARRRADRTHVRRSLNSWSVASSTPQPRSTTSPPSASDDSWLDADDTVATTVISYDAGVRSSLPQPAIVTRTSAAAAQMGTRTHGHVPAVQQSTDAFGRIRRGALS